MAKSIKKPRPVMLDEVVVTASKIRKDSAPQVRLSPKGMASAKSVDSLKRVGYGKAIGNPITRPGQTPQYGASSSDVIKKALSKKTVKSPMVVKNIKK